MKRFSLVFRQITIFCIFLSSCSLNQLAVNSSSSLLYEASNQAETLSNYEMFKMGAPGNLILMEGLLSASPHNLDILAALTKGYAGFAFLVNETDFLNEEWGELKPEQRQAEAQALLNYTHSLNFGLRYLKEFKIEYKDFLNQLNSPQGILGFLDGKLKADKRNLELLLFTAQSLGALINLQKDNMSLVAELPVVKAMFDWICSKDPQINYGTCGIFYGAYESARPKMLGGNPEKGKGFFLKTIATNPHNWLIRASFMQYYLIPQNDKEGFLEQLAFLKDSEQKFMDYSIYKSMESKENDPIWDWAKEKKLRLYQSLALKRFLLMNKYQAKFF